MPLINPPGATALLIPNAINPFYLQNTFTITLHTSTYLLQLQTARPSFEKNSPLILQKPLSG